MRRRCNLAHLILAGVVVFVLTLLMVDINAQARIAFVSNKDGNFEIYVMNPDGKNQQRLTNNPADEWDPSWAPGGKGIVFSSKRDRNSEIYVMDADGGNLQNLTNHPRGDFSPAWLNSPFSVAPAGKQFPMWGRLKGVDR